MEDSQNHLLNIWYICPMAKCNFSCSYCIASKQPSKLIAWPSEEEKARFKHIISRISTLPYSMGIRLQTVGEPFLSKTFLNSACLLTHKSNIRFIELVTNGSLLKTRLAEIQDRAVLSKLSLWATYHPEQISLDKFCKNILYAKELGLSVTVNHLLFPKSIKVTEQLQGYCKRHNIPFNMDLGQNHHDPQDILFPVFNSDVTSILKMYDNSLAPLITTLSSIHPYGQQCSAGHDYLFVDKNGNVFPCKCYSSIPNHCIGSFAGSNSQITLRKEKFHLCSYKKRCLAKEDYSHLKVFEPFLNKNRKTLGFHFSMHQNQGKSINQISEDTMAEINAWTIKCLLHLADMKNKSDYIGFKGA